MPLDLEKKSISRGSSLSNFNKSGHKQSERQSEIPSSQQQSVSEMLSDDEYFFVPANDLDKESIQIQVINDDHGSNVYAPAESVHNKSGTAGYDIQGAARRSLEARAGSIAAYESS